MWEKKKEKKNTQDLWGINAINNKEIYRKL